MSDWRPIAGGEVPLTDRQLAKMGLLVSYEASAKITCATMLRTLRNASAADWKRFQRNQFGQLIEKIMECPEADDEFKIRMSKLDSAVTLAIDSRNSVVHSGWGFGEADEAVSYDYQRDVLLTDTSLDDALNHGAELKRAANWAACRLAELVLEGRYTERGNQTVGLSLLVNNRLVRL